MFIKTEEAVLPIFDALSEEAMTQLQRENLQLAFLIGGISVALMLLTWLT